MSATVILLPVCVHADQMLWWFDRRGIDLGHQPLLPSCDRRNVVELWRIRLDREYEELRKAMRASRDAVDRARKIEEDRHG